MAACVEPADLPKMSNRMRLTPFLALLLVTGCAQHGLRTLTPPDAAHGASPGRPRVYILEAQQLEVSRQRIRWGDQTLAPALARLKSDAQAALKGVPHSVVDKDATPPSGDKHDYMSLAPYFWPDPGTSNGLPYIRRDGERNPEIGKIPDHLSLTKMTDTVEALALAYYFQGDAIYATRAAELIRIWFLNPATRMNPNLKYGQGIRGINTGRGIGIIETRDLVRVVDAIGLLAGSKAWTVADQRGTEEWFGNYLEWLVESDLGRDEASQKNNHGTYYDAQVASFALFLGMHDLAKDVLQNARARRIAVQIEPDGRQPLELVRTKAWSYSIGNLRGLMMLARLGENVGVDLWHYETSDGRSLCKALDYLMPFGLGEKKWSYQQIEGWQAQLLSPALAQAAARYLDPKYRAALIKLPPDPADRSRLLQPELDEFRGEVK
jgi:hypothetical protein